MNPLLRHFSDSELLIELTHRKRIRRIEASFIIEGWNLRMGEGSFFPDTYVKTQLFKDIGYEIAKSVLRGEFKVPGEKVERGYFKPHGYEGDPDKKITAGLYFVVEKQYES